jgi:hypothetical protein
MKDATKETLHCVAGWFAHLGLDMPIRRQRKGHRGMTKHLRHDKRLYAFQEQKCRGGLHLQWPDGDCLPGERLPTGAGHTAAASHLDASPMMLLSYCVALFCCSLSLL